MRLAYLTTAFFPCEKPLTMIQRSAVKAGIHLQHYGLREPYCIWAVMKITKKITALENLQREGYTHVLYTDGRDAFFTGSGSEIEEKYRGMGSPGGFASTEVHCNPDSRLIPHYPYPRTPYRFHCVGGYMGEIPWWLEKFRAMNPYVANEGDDAAIWQWGWRDGWFRPVLDTRCEIFQTISGNSESHLSLEGGRLYNTVTRSFPCVYHMNGGYSDPQYGKYDPMLGWWNRLHPDLPVEREEVSCGQP